MRKKLYNYFQNKIGSGDSWKDNFREQWRYPFIQAAHGGRIGYQNAGPVGGGIMDVVAEANVPSPHVDTPQQLIMDWLEAQGLPPTPENIQRAIIAMSRKGQGPSRQPQMDMPPMEMPRPPTGADYVPEELIGQDITETVTPAVAQMFPHERPEEEIDIYDYSDEEIEEIKRRFIEAGGDPSEMDKITRGQVAQGGRIGYQYGNEVTADAPGVMSRVPPSRVNQIQGNQMAEDAMNKIMQKFAEKFPDIEDPVSLETMVAMLQASGVLNTEGAGILDIHEGMKMITPESVGSSAQAISRHRDYIDAGGLAQGGRVPYGLGSLVKGVFKGAKKGVKSLVKSVKKFAKSDLGKAALLYIATAGMANIGAGAMGQPWLKGGAQWLRPSNVFGLGTGGWGNIGKSFTNLGFGASAPKAAGTGTWFNPAGGVGAAGKGGQFMEPLVTGATKAKDATGLLGSFKNNPMPWILGSSLGAGLYTKMNPGEDNLDELMRNYKGEVGEWDQRIADIRAGKIKTPFSTDNITYPYPDYSQYAAEGGRIGRAEGGLMDLGGMEKDYRAEGGFVPIGGKEKADDVPARLSRNEFVFTADAVRNAGGGDVDKGSEVMENIMTNLENGGNISEESQGLEGARDMFEVSERLSEVV